MGSWIVDGKSQPGVLILRIDGSLDTDQMRAFVDTHNQTIDSFAGRAYRVFCDLRTLTPLSPEQAKEFERAKLYSAAHSNFQGSAVLVTSQLIAMQHRRTSTTGGVMDTELISDDEAACWAHLRRIRRARALLRGA